MGDERWIWSLAGLSRSVESTRYNTTLSNRISAWSGETWASHISDSEWDSGAHLPFPTPLGCRYLYSSVSLIIFIESQSFKVQQHIANPVIWSPNFTMSMSGACHLPSGGRPARLSPFCQQKKLQQCRSASLRLRKQLFRPNRTHVVDLFSKIYVHRHSNNKNNRYEIFVHVILY